MSVTHNGRQYNSSSENDVYQFIIVHKIRKNHSCTSDEFYQWTKCAEIFRIEQSYWTVWRRSRSKSKPIKLHHGYVTYYHFYYVHSSSGLFTLQCLLIGAQWFPGTTLAQIASGESTSSSETLRSAQKCLKILHTTYFPTKINSIYPMHDPNMNEKL